MSDDDLKNPSQLSENEDFELDTKIPWHFWVIVCLVVIYLGYRLVQMLILGFNAIF